MSELYQHIVEWTFRKNKIITNDDKNRSAIGKQRLPDKLIA